MMNLHHRILSLSLTGVLLLSPGAAWAAESTTSAGTTEAGTTAAETTAAADTTEAAGTTAADQKENKAAETTAAEPESEPVPGIRYVHLITAQEIEIGCDDEITKEAAGSYTVTVNGASADFEYLSCFDNMATLRLAEPLEDPENAEVSVTIDGTAIEAGYVPFYTITENALNVQLPVKGNENSGMNDTYDYQYVLDYCVNNMGQILGQSDYTGLAATENGVTIVVVGSDQSVYVAPEYRELYNPDDAKTRRTIPGTADKPIIVTTADDVMRQDSMGDMERKKSDRYELIHDFSILYWELGITPGWKNYPLSEDDDPDTYNYVKHVETAYANAQDKGLWPGTAMMDSAESYFTYGSMVWFETIPESEDGSWQKETFPVNTRAELREYDKNLYDCLVEIYTEYKYLCGSADQCNTGVDSEIRMNQPWYKHNQVDNYGIDGKAYDPLCITEANLISRNQIEVVFNREVRDLDALRTNANWAIDWVKDGKTTTFSGEEGETAITVQRYQWKTLTFLLGDPDEEKNTTNLSTGSIGSSIMGFTKKDLEDPPEWLANDPDVKVSDTALEKGGYIDVDTLISERGAGIDGTLTVKAVSGGDAMCDWADNPLGNGSWEVKFRPYLGQAYRSKKAGVYVYGDNDVKKSSLELAGAYIDIILSNKTDHIGQKLADGMVKDNLGAQIIAYGHHAYQQPDLRYAYGNDLYMRYLYVEGFGGGICQTTESNLLRDIAYTRYKGEFILGHEFAHTLHSASEVYLPELFQAILDTYNGRNYDRDDGSSRWPDDSYAGSNEYEYFATLSNIWHGTMRESASGTWDGTLSPINTREELYRYDPKGYELMKKIYYNGRTNLFYSDGTKVKVDADDDDVLKWGSTFPESMTKKYPEAKWIHWAAANEYDFDPDNPEGPGIPLAKDKINYNPYYNEPGVENPDS